ncbi:hypothetical protein Taro_036594 [Colocasia esculenta]|uniref:Uncharacterized protein n=1 Tax=Colocasia esculenta TaxID=4460 RepID=A0A843W3G1_COLES|nr:hypothetical protein [Colocasia esculenta]
MAAEGCPAVPVPINPVFFFIVVLTQCTAVMVHSQSQEGFISIDCGIADGAGYRDNSSGIVYVPIRFRIEVPFRARDACADSLALRLTSLRPVLWHLRACPSARCAFGLLPFPGTPILVGPLRVVSEPRVRPSSVSPDEGENGVGQRR